MRITYTLLFVCLVSLAAFAQNAPVPAYLTTQDFPDSVKVLRVVPLQGKARSFGEMLDQYKGKKVVLDIWASWCRDCLVGYPKLDDLMKRTADQNVVYVFLSIDEKADKWKTAIERFSMQGEHYRIPAGWKNRLSNYGALDWVPRYMLLNEEGRVIGGKAITSEELETMLK